MTTAGTNGWVVPEPPKKRTGKKVAVVGSGPAGLCAAAQLNKAGHTVTVFERADRPGGLLMYGIPNMKLDKKQVVLRRIKQMEAEGVKFVCNTEVGKNYPAEKLLKEFDAVILATGATKPRDLPIEGRNFKGIHFAMDFLTANTSALLDRHKNGRFHCRRRQGRRSSSAAATPARTAWARRCGTAARAWCRWKFCPSRRWNAPRTIRGRNGRRFTCMDYGQEEAAAKFGADPRVYLTTAKKFNGDAHGQVKEALTVQIQWERNDKGQFIPKDVPGTEKVLPAQLVLLAMGFLGPEQPLLEALSSNATRAATSRPSSRNTRPTSRACLPPATAVAARAWSCGRSTKAAARRANATAI